MGVHLNESKTTVGLESRLDNVTEVGEQRDKIVLGRVRGQVTHVTGCLPTRSLADNHVVAVNTMSGEVVVTIGRGGSHAHGLHSGLLGNGRLALLVGPVASNGARTKPLAVHRAQCLLGLTAVTEGDESITTGAAGLHIPHDTSLGDGAEGRESLHQNLIVDLVGKVTHKNVEVV